MVGWRAVSRLCQDALTLDPSPRPTPETLTLPSPIGWAREKATARVEERPPHPALSPERRGDARRAAGSSLTPKRHHRIDFRCATGGNQTGKKGDGTGGRKAPSPCPLPRAERGCAPSGGQF